MRKRRAHRESQYFTCTRLGGEQVTVATDWAILDEGETWAPHVLDVSLTDLRCSHRGMCGIDRMHGVGLVAFCPFASGVHSKIE